MRLLQSVRDSLINQVNLIYVFLPVLTVDQLAKYYFSLQIGQGRRFIGKIAFFPNINADCPFGEWRWACFILLILLILFLARYHPPGSNFLMQLGLGLIFGGAISNAFSWLFPGYVVDYICINMQEVVLVSINIADVGIYGGAFLMTLGILSVGLRKSSTRKFET